MNLSHDAGVSDALDRRDVGAVATGDTAAFERLYARHAPRVFALAKWIGSPEDCEDLTQEIFLLVWRKSHTWNGSAEFATWLRRLSINVILSHRRARPMPSLSLDNVDEPVAAKNQPDLQLTIEAGIESLPTEMRDVFVLHDVEGYRHEEIAGLLNIATGTSASRLHRARLILKEVLSDS